MSTVPDQCDVCGQAVPADDMVKTELTVAGAGSQTTIIGLLDARLPAPIAEADQSITVAPADPATATQLGCPAGDPLLRIDRLYSDTAGRPVELAVSHFLPEQYTYRVTLRRSS